MNVTVIVDRNGPLVFHYWQQTRVFHWVQPLSQFFSHITHRAFRLEPEISMLSHLGIPECLKYGCAAFVLSGLSQGKHYLVTSSDGNIFHITGPWWGESTSHRLIPLIWPLTQSFDVFFDLCLNKLLSKQSRCRRFETPSCSLWCHCNDNIFLSLEKQKMKSVHETFTFYIQL